MLTTEHDDRFPEALGYIEQAKELHPNDPYILERGKEIVQAQRNWYLYMARESMVRSGRWFGDLNQELGVKYTIECVEYFLRALAIVPDDMVSLEALRLATSTGSKFGVQWWDAVKLRLNSYDWLRSKQIAPKQLEELHTKLDALKAKLPQLEKKHGLFAKADLEDAHSEISKLSAEIERWQAAADYQPPK